MWLVRLAAWGTVLLMALVAFNVRTGSSAPDEGGEQRNGTTNQRKPVWAVVDGDRVHEIGITWQLECDNGAELRKFSATFGPGRLRHHRQRFRAADESTLRGGPHIRSELSGTVGPDSTVTGRSDAVLSFEQGTVCRSGPVTWSIPAS